MSKQGEVLKVSFKIKDLKKVSDPSLITINNSTIASVKGALEAQININ